MTRVNVAKLAVVPRWVIMREGMRGNPTRIATYVAVRVVEYANQGREWASERELADDLAEVSGVGPEATRKHLRAMRALGVILGDAGTLIVPTDEPSGDTGPHSGDVRPQSGDTGPHAPLLTREKDIDVEPSVRKPRRSSFPEQWEPGEAEREAATSAGMDATARREQWSQFRDHHLAHGKLMTSWPAAWRYWCRNWRKFNHVEIATPLAGPHRDAGKILYRADGSRFRREADGSATELPPEDES